MKCLQFNATAPLVSRPVAVACAAIGVSLAGAAVAAPLDGQVLGGGAPIANSTRHDVAAGAGAPGNWRRRAAMRTAASRWPHPMRRWLKASLYLVARAARLRPARAAATTRRSRC